MKRVTVLYSFHRINEYYYPYHSTFFLGRTLHAFEDQLFWTYAGIIDRSLNEGYFSSSFKLVVVSAVMSQQLEFVLERWLLVGKYMASRQITTDSLWIVLLLMNVAVLPCLCYSKSVVRLSSPGVAWPYTPHPHNLLCRKPRSILMRTRSDLETDFRPSTTHNSH